MIGHFGTAYIIGMQKPGATIDVTIDPMNPLALSPREAGLRGVNMGSVNPKRDIARFATPYLQGRFNLDDLVSRPHRHRRHQRGLRGTQVGRHSPHRDHLIQRGYGHLTYGKTISKSNDGVEGGVPHCFARSSLPVPMSAPMICVAPVRGSMDSSSFDQGPGHHSSS